MLRTHMAERIYSKFKKKIPQLMSKLMVLMTMCC